MKAFVVTSVAICIFGCGGSGSKPTANEQVKSVSLGDVFSRSAPPATDPNDIYKTVKDLQLTAESPWNGKLIEASKNGNVYDGHWESRLFFEPLPSEEENAPLQLTIRPEAATLDDAITLRIAEYVADERKDILFEEVKEVLTASDRLPHVFTLIRSENGWDRGDSLIEQIWIGGSETLGTVETIEQGGKHLLILSSPQFRVITSSKDPATIESIERTE